MRTVERGFVGARLRLARGFQGMTQSELAEKVSVSPQFIGYLEADQKSPSPVLADALSEACGVTVAFFGVPRLNEFRDEECHFRRRHSTPVSVRVRVLAHGTLFGQFVEYIDEQVSLPAYVVPRIAVKEPEDIEKAAERCRVEWGLGRDLPIKNLTRALERAGIVVTRFEGAAEKVDAFSRSGTRGVIVLNTDKGSPSRTRFDASHECGHLVMHGDLTTDSAEREKEADRFASALLLPRLGFAREFPRSPRLDWEAVFRLKHRWRVSAAAIIRRAYDLRLIEAMQYQRAYKYMAAQGWLKGEPHEFDDEAPEVVVLAIQELERQGVALADVCSSLSWRPATFERVTGLSIPVETPKGGGKVVRLRPITVTDRTRAD